MAKQRTVKWHEVDKEVQGLETDIEHQVNVQREAIPLIFVPGIMGTRLRAAGTDGTGDANGLPNMRWDPSSAGFMLSKYYGTAGSTRKSMLVGNRFSPSYLEVHNASPVGNGFQGVHDDYLKFLTPLAQWNWKPLDKIFDFPVYAVGYNWTDSNENSGKMLAARITDIIAEAAKVTGQCEKVIVLTHSMGGLVARWASQQAGAKDSILGIIHCVQPVTGATAAYWRMKAGFEGGMVASAVLGDSAYTVTPILANIPGGLQLLPNKLHVANDGSSAWLRVTSKVGLGGAPASLPSSSPYDDIYRVKVTVTNNDPINNPKPTVSQWWGLVDPGILDPRPNTSNPGFDLPEDSNDSLNAQRATSAWTEYLRVLQIAETFHDTLGKDAHPVTFCIRGTGKPSGTCDVVRFEVTTNWIQTVVYGNQGFRGLFQDSSGNNMQAVLQDPDGAGDGTVPSSSAGTLNAPGKPSPGDADFPVEHQPAYQNDAVQAFAVKAILALVKKRYYSLRTGDFPPPSSAAAAG
jgi:pimeloyl-ACP methyl ester carboxylesterase